MSAEFLALFVGMQGDVTACAAAKKSGIVLQFRLLAPPSFVVLDLGADPFAVSAEEHPDPGVELTLTLAAAHEILSGRLPVAQAAAAGSVRARGGILRLLALQAFLEQTKAGYRSKFGQGRT